MMLLVTTLNDASSTTCELYARSTTYFYILYERVSMCDDGMVQIKSATDEMKYTNLKEGKKNSDPLA